MPKNALTLMAEADTSAIRHEDFQGADHLVVPVIALVEGVHWAANAPAPELALATEFGRFPQGWNGRPVVLNHPMKDGDLVSASSPDIAENEVFGQLFNTTIEDKKLHSEIWINLDRVAELGEDVQAAVQSLESGEMMEVSVGAFMDILPGKGTFGGELYEGIWTGIVPDHLALLPEAIGACSIEDGCGAPRMNMRHTKTAESLKDVEKMIKAATEGTEGSAKLVASAGPKTEKSATKEPGVGLLEKFKGIFKTQKTPDEGELSDVDIRRALDAALIAAETEPTWIWVTAVFKDTVVYERGETLFARTFTVDSEGNIGLEDDITAVRPETSFVPINPQPEGNQMTDLEKRVNALVANSLSSFEEGDTEWLNGLSEERIKTFEDQAIEPEAASAGEETPAEKPSEELGDDTSTPSDDTSTPMAAQSPEEYIAAAPTEMQSVLQEGLTMQRTRKDALVAGLKANSRCTFSEEQLQAKDLLELESLAKLADIPTYEGRSPVSAAASNEDANSAPEPLVPKWTN